MIFTGIDLSLTSTGLARIHTAPYLDPAVTVERFETKPVKQPLLFDRFLRLRSIALWVASRCADSELVAVEGPNLGAPRQVGTFDLWGLTWLTVRELLALGFDVVEIPPSSRMRYATGKGNAAKDRVLAAAINRYRMVQIGGHDEADAVILAAMAARYCDHPIETSMPVTHLAGMGNIRWPERASDEFDSPVPLRP